MGQNQEISTMPKISDYDQFDGLHWDCDWVISNYRINHMTKQADWYHRMQATRDCYAYDRKVIEMG